MVTATFPTELKANLKYFMEKAVSGDSIIITRPKKKNVVLISEEEYNRLQKIESNAAYLHKLKLSAEQSAQGKVVIKSMEELEAMADE